VHFLVFLFLALKTGKKGYYFSVCAFGSLIGAQIANHSLTGIHALQTASILRAIAGFCLLFSISSRIFVKFNG
jgi:hypothetical protein